MDSLKGYYRDSFDYEALRRVLLDPFGDRGDRRYRVAVFDYLSDEPVDKPAKRAPAEAILLVDGVFLQRS